MLGTVLSTIHTFSHLIFMQFYGRVGEKLTQSHLILGKAKSDFRVRVLYVLLLMYLPCNLNIFSPFLLLRERNFPTTCHIYKLEIVEAYFKNYISTHWKKISFFVCSFVCLFLNSLFVFKVAMGEVWALELD